MRHGISARLRSASVFAVAIAFAAPAWAQTGSPEADIDALIDASSTNAGAIAGARAQADGGDLLGAAATLERALLSRPGAESDDVRLYYATVLCGLDDRRRAAYQLGNVRNAALPGWGEARAACGDAAVPAPAPTSRGKGVWGEISAGLAYDGDSYGALNTQFDLPAIKSLSDDGLSVVTSGRLDARFGGGERSYFYGGLAFASKDNISGPNLDYQVGEARLGFASKLGEGADFSIGPVARHARLFNDPFVTEYGGQASFGWNQGERGHWSVEGEIVDQDYLGGVFPSLRDGTRYDVALTYQRATAENSNWAVGAAFEAKDARQRDLGYRGYRLFAATRFPLSDGGTYLGLSGTVRHTDYRSPAVVTPFTTDLKEWRLFGRAAVGIPLGPKGLFLEPAVSYTARLYNNASGLRDYNSVGAELRLVFRFGK
jgi:hypothetical protein